MNMDISRTVLEGKWDNWFIDTAQKVALYTIIPFILIAALEAIVKNLILINLANCAIAILNVGYNTIKSTNLCPTIFTNDRVRN